MYKLWKILLLAGIYFETDSNEGGHRDIIE
jgi:hypothetical protein